MISLGWSTEKGDLQGPVGYDKYSFSYRNSTGQKFYRARGKPYGVTFGAGDTIGMMIKTTGEIEERDSIVDLPKERKKSKWAKETTIYSKKVDEPQKINVMAGSEIGFFVNGKYQGIAFADIEEGNYYPAVSLFMGARCHLQFGPEFTFPIPSDHPYHSETLPLCSVVPKEHPKVEPVPIPQTTPVIPNIPVETPALVTVAVAVCDLDALAAVADENLLIPHHSNLKPEQGIPPVKSIHYMDSKPDIMNTSKSTTIPTNIVVTPKFPQIEKVDNMKIDTTPIVNVEPSCFSFPSIVVAGNTGSSIEPEKPDNNVVNDVPVNKVHQ